ncbi:endonuclease domain-containing protein [Cohnella massiliensis]|uniref:endonuclease domain-containing protein n=1 Tax=Paenibacillaceae TaxID=186822 RepID=UPI0009BB6A08|nr:DUF559 domain-containing protein [Cohnella massiliensis]
MPKDLSYWKREIRALNDRMAERNEEISSKWTPIEQITWLILQELVKVFGMHNISIMPQERIERYRVDFLIRYEPLHASGLIKNLVIECDGHEWHEKTKEQAQKDKERDRALTKLGYTVLRYTGSEIVDDPWKIYRDIEELLLPNDVKRGFGYRPIDGEG